MAKMNLQSWTDIKIVATLAKHILNEGGEISKKSDITTHCMRALYANVEVSDIFQTDAAAISFLKSIGISPGEMREQPVLKISKIANISKDSRLDGILDDIGPT